MKRTGILLPSALAIAIVVASTPSRADEAFEIAPYAAWRRPLTPVNIDSAPQIKRNITGAGLEWTDTPAWNRTGWVLRFGGALEYQAECPTRSACPFPSGDVDHVEYGAHARGGWMWRYVQLEGGILGYTSTTIGVTSGPETKILPDAVVRIGPRTTFGALGFGSFTVANVLAPMTYLQGQIDFAEKWTTTITYGMHAQPFAATAVDRYMHMRFDVAMRYLLARSTRVGVGFAMTRSDTTNAGHARLGGELRLVFEWLRE